MADAKLSTLTELAATPASDDELYIRDISEAAAEESKRITVANLSLAVSPSSSGSYSGNDTDNRAITHSLGKTPKIVFIHRASKGLLTIIAGIAVVFNVNQSGNQYSGAVTALDSTNFYVGDAAPDYSSSGNGTGNTYYWVAIG